MDPQNNPQRPQIVRPLSRTEEQPQPAPPVPDPGGKPPSPQDYTVPPPPPQIIKRRFRGLSSVLSTLALLILAPVIAVSIAAFVVQSYQVDGQSMETTLQNNDRLIVDKWPRTWARITKNPYIPKRGEIIIFNQTGLDFGGGTKQLIKRVIALPGERVSIKSGKVTVFNEEFPSGFNPDSAGGYKISDASTPGDADLILGEDEIFVLGDNRTNSEDSRYFGPVGLDNIVGELAFRVIPLSKAQKF